MKILSVNTGKLARIGMLGAKTGIAKLPRDGAVAVGPLGLDGDAIGNLKHHGGPDQAVYVYMREDYDYWEGELGRAMPPGQFGENLTASGFTSLDVSAGDRFTSGPLVLEVTSPRIPCSVFARHMDIADLPDRFMKAGRSGFYCRVIAEGTVAAGDVFTRAAYSGSAVTIRQMMADYPYKRLSDDWRAAYLAAPIHRNMAAYLRGERGRP